MKKGVLVFLVVFGVVFLVGSVVAEESSRFTYQCYDLDLGDNLEVRGNMVVKKVPVSSLGGIFNPLNWFRDNELVFKSFEESCGGDDKVKEYSCQGIPQDGNEIIDWFEFKDCLYGCEFGKCLTSEEAEVRAGGNEEKYTSIYFNCEPHKPKSTKRFYDKWNEKFESSNCKSKRELLYRAEVFCLSYYKSPDPETYEKVYRYFSPFPESVLDGYKVGFFESCSLDCISKTCENLELECGSVDDGCGNVNYCGDCEEGLECIENICRRNNVKKDCKKIGKITSGYYSSILKLFGKKIDYTKSDECVTIKNKDNLARYFCDENDDLDVEYIECAIRCDSEILGCVGEFGKKI